MAGTRILLILLSLLALLPHVTGFWRMECPTYKGLYRVDPIVSPNNLSNHAHVFSGSSGISMNSTYDDLINAKSTSCRVYQDKSAYWTPALMFEHPDGTIQEVPRGGLMLAYYFNHGKNVKAFPAGFRMVAGNSSQRTFHWPVPDPSPYQITPGSKLDSQLARAQRAVGYDCLRQAGDSRGQEGSLYRHTLPERKLLDTDCKGGFRIELTFPSCWNGKDLDSPDHMSHVRYSSLLQGEGDCPKGFEHRLPTLFYENVYNTYSLRNTPGRYYLSNNDETGLSYHGDFIMGWNVNLLQAALDHPICGQHDGDGRTDSCPLFTIDQSKTFISTVDDLPKGLSKLEVSKENCAGPRKGLCGDLTMHNKLATDPTSATTQIAQQDTSDATNIVDVSQQDAPVSTVSAEANQQGVPALVTLSTMSSTTFEVSQEGPVPFNTLIPSDMDQQDASSSVMVLDSETESLQTAVPTSQPISTSLDMGENLTSMILAQPSTLITATSPVAITSQETSVRDITTTILTTIISHHLVEEILTKSVVPAATITTIIVVISCDQSD